MLRNVLLVGLSVVALHACSPKEEIISVVPYDCGDVSAVVEFDGPDRVQLTVGDVTHDLRIAISASGARYTSDDSDAPVVVYWSKGNDATITIVGSPDLECRVKASGAVVEVGQVEPVAETETQIAANAAPFVDVEWGVVSVGGAAVTTSRPLMVNFGGEGNVYGFSGCNNFRGSYTIESETVQINPNLITTRMACLDGDTAAQERVFLEVFPTVVAVEMTSPTQAVLRDANGEVMMLEAMTPAAP